MARLSDDEFKKYVKNQLDKLSKEQAVAFARRCALHALPYLYQQGHMDFWPQAKRMHYAYAIFNALDCCHADVILEDYHIKSAAAAAYVAAAAAAAAYYFNSTDIQPLLIEELQAIANNQTPPQVEFPPKLLENFQQALDNENCGYWAKLYLKIFANNFAVDVQELQLRLNVPEEIKAQGAAAVGLYIEQLLSQGAERLNESRILILGDKGAGKTCLARRLKNPQANMTTTDESTAGVETTLWTLTPSDTRSETKVRIWDFAGHTVTHAVHQFFLSERCLYILVYDGRLDNGSSLEYWLDHMENYGGNSKAVIVVNEKDQHKAQIPINKLKAKYAIESVYYLSIADVQQVEDLRSYIADLISQNPCWNSQLIPKHYYQVKEDLERLFNQSANDKDIKEHIKLAEFKNIARKHDIDDVEQLLKDLNALGISLWYPELGKFGKLVLNPEWISHGVYKIINWVANQASSYTISLGQFKQVFASGQDALRYGVEQHEFLFSLIKHYELAYQSQFDPQNLTIPHLLNEDQPDEQDMPTFGVGESLMLEYRAGQPLPPHTISRFIVRHNKQIKQNLVWRSGVVLVDSDYQDTIALVNEDDRTIAISVKGSNKSAYIATLRDTMNDIFDSYKSDKPELVYEVIPYGPQGQLLTLNKPLMLPEQRVINHVESGENYFEDQTKQRINLIKTANIYNIKTDNFYHGDKINVDNSTTYNYQDCNFELQGDLNDLATELIEANHQAQAKQLQNTVAALEKAENCQTPAEVKKSGVGKRVARLLEDMGDKNSTLSKVIAGTKNGVSIAQDLAEQYNGIAQWAGLPQVPKPFLKKDK